MYDYGTFTVYIQHFFKAMFPTYVARSVWTNIS